MRCIIHKQLKEKDTDKFLKLLEYYKKELQDYDQTKIKKVQTINGFQKVKILQFKKYKI